MKKILTLILTFICITLQLSAYDFKYDGIYYNITQPPTSGGILVIPTVEVTAYSFADDGVDNNNAYKGIINIPSRVTYNGDNYNVTSIGAFAFYKCANITSINIPASIEEIDGRAFAYCSSLTSFNVNASNSHYSSIGGVLYNSSATELVSYPNAHSKDTSITISARSIGDCAFIGNSTLTEINLMGVSYIGDYSFGDCKKLTNITLGDGLSTIGEYAFGGCDELHNVVIPSKLFYTSSKAFDKSGLKKVYILGSPFFFRNGNCFKNLSNLEFIILDPTSFFADNQNLSEVFNSNTKLWIPTDNYNIVNAGSLDIDYLIKLSDTSNSKIYDGTPLQVSYENNYTFPINIEPLSIIDSGNYTVNLEFLIADSEIDNSIQKKLSFSVPYSFIIEQREAQLNLSNVSRTYGEDNPVAINYSFENVLDKDVEILRNLLSLKFDADKFSDVGNYTISAIFSECKNYVLTVKNSILTVNKAPLTLIAGSVARPYYCENPAFEFALSGLLNGDDASCLIKVPTYICEATINSECGDYPIIPCDAEAKNYEIEYKSGILKVTKAPLNISVKDCSRLYGDANPRFEFIYSGLREGADAISILSKLPVATSSARAASPIGYYDIEVSGADATNYDITYTPGILTVEKAPIVIRPKDTTKVYGQPNPVFELSYFP